MRLLLTAALALVAACGTTPDERPVTFEVVTLSVLKPTCGQVQCHSTTTRTEGYAFDTIDASRESLKMADGLFDLDDVLQTDDASRRMPPDVPLADEDLALVVKWLVAGTPGL